jgi:hypothetical protein
MTEKLLMANLKGCKNGKEAVVAYFKTLSQHVHGRCEETHEIHCLRHQGDDGVIS